ncbi:MAG: hypothetical protein GX758_04495 [Tenericutes bacterium]|nr:hypothetical protein [Mycoplasmatota bacterium]
MSNNYEDYGYEDTNGNNRGNGTVKKIIISIIIIIAIILLICLLKNWFGKEGTKTPVIPTVFNYESNLLDAGKKFYENNPDLAPTAIGDCAQVDLQALIARGLVDPTKYATCNQNTTFVNVCKLENGTKQFTPWLSCTDKSSENEYGDYKEGTLADLVTDKSLVQFSFLPQKLKTSGNGLGKVEEIWKDDIKYSSYKTLATTTYYRYRDLLYIWNVDVKKYYTSKGEKNSASEVSEYYTVSPNPAYNLHDSQTTSAYKWFTSESEKIYAMTNGAKTFSDKAINGYPYNDGGVVVTKYFTRTILNTYNPTFYYQCALSKNATTAVNQTMPCGQGPNPQLVYQKTTFYSCVADSGSSILDNIVPQGTICKNYSDWEGPKDNSCGTVGELCDKMSVTFYNWYKLSGTVTKTYYPSGSSNAATEKVYYTKAPVTGAQKDDTTKTTAYKWYKATPGLSAYSAVAPQEGATKTTTSSWGEWTDFKTTNPKVSDGRTRQIENKIKIKLQQITGTTTEESWEDLSANYVSEEEMIKIFKDKNYSVNSLLDISNHGDIRYKVKMMIRNKTEVTNNG